MIPLTPQEALELPVDELALYVLADLVDSNEWNEYNYTLPYIQQGYRTSNAAQHAIAEALCAKLK